MADAVAKRLAVISMVEVMSDQTFSLLAKVDLLVPFSPYFRGCEHATRSTLIAKGCLTSTMCTATRDTRNTCDSSTCKDSQFPPPFIVHFCASYQFPKIRLRSALQLSH